MTHNNEEYKHHFIVSLGITCVLCYILLGFAAMSAGYGDHSYSDAMTNYVIKPTIFVYIFSAGYTFLFGKNLSIKQKKYLAYASVMTFFACAIIGAIIFDSLYGGIYTSPK